jgi:hypothetical protein
MAEGGSGWRKEAWFEVFEGDCAYNKEAEAILNISPPLNKRGPRK